MSFALSAYYSKLRFVTYECGWSWLFLCLDWVKLTQTLEDYKTNKTITLESVIQYQSVIIIVLSCFSLQAIDRIIHWFRMSIQCVFVFTVFWICSFKRCWISSVSFSFSLSVQCPFPSHSTQLLAAILLIGSILERKVVMCLVVTWDICNTRCHRVEVFGKDQVKHAHSMRHTIIRFECHLPDLVSCSIFYRKFVFLLWSGWSECNGRNGWVLWSDVQRR